MLTPGNTAPNFSGIDIVGGGTFSLSDHSGDVVCLAMSAYWCSHCTNELTRLQHLWTKFQGHGVQIAAVHVDSNQAAAQTWLSYIGVTFPVVQDDASNTIFNSYATGYSGIPQLYIIDRDQVIHYSHAGAEAESVIEGHILDAVYARDPVSIELVMDVSSSMNSAPSGGDSKLVMMKQATKMIVDFLCDHGQTSDRCGLVWFSDNATEYTNSSGQKLIPVIANASDLKSQIDAQGTGTCTAMGAGLQTAFNTLSASTQDRFAILLTDGMQNIEPKIAQVGSHYEIIDSAGWLCGSHSSTPAQPGVDITTYNTTVHSIGVGITATYASLLQDIAIATDGFYLGTNDPASDLDLIYFVDLCNCLAGGSPAVVHHHAGTYYPKECRAVEVFQINSSARKLTAVLSWEKALAGTLVFWLRAPDGTLVDLHGEMKFYDAYAMATVYLPKEQDGKQLPYVGQWEMIVGGETAGATASYHTMIIAEDPDTRLIFDYPKKVYDVGDIVPLRIRLKEAKHVLVQPSEIILEKIALRIPVPELLAQYKVTPYQLREKMRTSGRKYELDPLEMKLEALASDPRMQKQLQPLRKSFSLKEGTLDCEITDEEIILPIRLTEPGLNSFRIAVHFESEKNGPISRVSMAAIHVSPGKAASGKSTVKLFRVSLKEARSVLFHFTPRNAASQLLGPGLSDDFRVRLGRNKVECQVEDKLDGTYHVEVPLSKKLPPKGQQISLIFKGQTAWKGIIE